MIRDFTLFKEIMLIVLFLSIIMGFVVAIGLISGHLVGKKRCAEYSTALKITTHHSFWTGCIIEFQDGKKINLDKYLILDTPAPKIP